MREQRRGQGNQEEASRDAGGHPPEPKAPDPRKK
jgi:hypothetical protein